jgi:hypothetical protein
MGFGILGGIMEQPENSEYVVAVTASVSDSQWQQRFTEETEYSRTY